MNMNAKALAAWVQAQRFLRECEADPLGARDYPPQVEYVLRRVMGKADASERDFVQAWNESPVVDADEDTVLGEILVRRHEAKDGVE